MVASQTINMPSRTNTIMATILLTSKATTVVEAPEADLPSPSISDEHAATVAVV